MKVAVFLCLFLIGVITIEAYPQNVKAKRLTRPYTLIRGYVPKNRRSAYFQPPGVMTAYAHGDMITANSYMGEQTPLNYYEPESQNANNNNNIPYDGNNGNNNIQQPLNNIPVEINPEESQEASASDLDLSTNDSTEETIKEQVYKATTTEKSIAVDANNKDEEDGDDYWPFNKRLRGFPSYNAFFPIMIGGYTNGRERRTENGGYPGSATAIANSFSTGKGGVASSHATAYGDPYLSTLLRNNGNGLKKKPTSDLQE